MTRHTQVATAPESEMRTPILVIGSGPGGSIVATLLAERGREVLLVEEGPFLASDSSNPFSIEEMVEKYRNGGLTVAIARPKIAYVEGRCVGGGSEINSGLYHRTPPEVLASWRQKFGVVGLSDDDMEPHFSACERDVSVSMIPGGRAPPPSERLHRGAISLNWRSQEVPRWFRFDGTQDAFGVPRGTRQSMTQTFIPRFLKAGGRLLPDVRIVRLRRSANTWRAEGVGQLGTSTGTGPRSFEVTAETVFVCGGTIHGAALLRRSGLVRNIGDRFQMHPTIKVVALFPDRVNGPDMGVPVHQVKEFAPRFSMGCSISTAPYLGLSMLDHPRHRGLVDREWERMAIYYAMITGGGEGSIRNLPRTLDPIVRYHFAASAMHDLAEGLRRLCQALLAGGAEACFPCYGDAPVIRNESDLALLPSLLPAGDSQLMTIHLFGSCPMGERDEVCAVDSFGAVRDAPGLRVADASVIPSAPGVNPQGTVMALARRCALEFLGDLR